MEEGFWLTPPYILVTPIMQFQWLDPIWALLLALSKLTPGHSRVFFRKDIHQIVGPAHTKMDEPHSQRNAVINNIPLGAASNV